MSCKLTIGEKIADLIHERGITADKLSKDLDISKGTISDLINNVDKNFGYKNFVKLSNYFNVSVDYLLGLSDVKEINENIKFINKYIGLSETSINALHKLTIKNKERSNKEIEIIDFMLIDTFLQRFSFLIGEILRYKKMLLIDEIKNTNKIQELQDELENANRQGYDTSFIEWDIKTRKSEDFEQKEFFKFKQWEMLKEIESELSDLINNIEYKFNEDNTDGNN